MNNKVICIYIYVIYCQERLVQIERKKTKKNCSLAMKTLRQQIETTEKSNKKNKNNNRNSKLIIKIIKY